jgi:Zn-finger nucleic acid-binding protein
MDAGDSAPGTVFRCLCGAEVVVPRAEAHSSAVVRCSSCGATRSGEARFCAFCGSDFTLHEQDLHTICPECFTRISDRARYCHSCAARIQPQGQAGDLTRKACPACGDGAHLLSRSFPGMSVAVLECDRCAGLWLDHDLLKAAVEKARDKALPVELFPRRSDASTFGVEPPAPPTGAKFYRECPECSKQMLRKNWGRKSGVIVDLCSAHGVWFDSEELERMLRWVREGGLEAAKRTAEVARPSPPPAPAMTMDMSSSRSSGGGILGTALEVLLWVGIDSLFD